MILVHSFDLFGWYQHRGAFVLHEEHDEFRRFGLASVSPDDVNILRAFIEGLTRCQSHFFPAPDLHYDRAFQHINKPMCVVAMYWVRAARRILNHEHQTFLARKVRQVFRHELRQLSLGSVVAAIVKVTLHRAAKTTPQRRRATTLPTFPGRLDGGVACGSIAFFCEVVRLSHSSKRVVPRRGFSPGTRL